MDGRPGWVVRYRSPGLVEHGPDLYLRVDVFAGSAANPPAASHSPTLFRSAEAAASFARWHPRLRRGFGRAEVVAATERRVLALEAT